MSYHGIPAYNELERFTDIPTSFYDFEETTGVRLLQVAVKKESKKWFNTLKVTRRMSAASCFLGY